MKFKPEDFDFLEGIECCTHLEMGSLHDVCIAKRANRLLEKWLAEAPTICELSSPMGTWVNGEPEGAISRAKLVCIEPI